MKFYGRYGDLIKQYEVPLSRMLHGILDDDHDIFHWSGMTPIFDPITDLDLITEFDLLTNCERFPWNICDGRSVPTEDAYSPDSWSCPTLGLASVLMLRPISPELVMFPDFWVSNIPRYFCGS